MDSRCDHYWLCRRGGTCGYCKAVFPGNLKPALGEADIIKTCTCCSRAITRAEWAQLRYVGVQADDVMALEMRDCVCRSTLAIELGPEFRTPSPTVETREAA